LARRRRESPRFGEVEDAIVYAAWGCPFFKVFIKKQVLGRGF